MQSRICKHLRHPSEAFSVGIEPDAREERMDPLEIDLCAWLTSKVGEHIPPALSRRAGGGVGLNDGDCDTCPCFEPIEAPAIPTTGDQK